MSRRVQAIVIGLVFSAGMTACPQPNKLGCGTPADGLYENIAAGIPLEGGANRNPRTYAAGSKWTFVSVEHRTPSQVKNDHSGHILTFAVDNQDPAKIFAVDERARTESTFPDAAFDVREKGAVESRGCTYNARTDKTTTK